MASAPSSKEWKEVLLSPKVLVPVAATVGVVATAGCIYYCWPKEKGKGGQSKRPKARPVNAVPTDPKPPVVTAKTEDKEASDVVVENEKKETDVPTAPANGTGSKKEVQATEDEEKVCVCAVTC